jgi:hypothetical protein
MTSKTWLAACCAWLALLCACGGDDPQVGGETHWLSACDENADCGDDLRCICGSCTRACSADDACHGNRPAACYDMGSPLLLQRCPGLSGGHGGGVCLPSCSADAQCSDDKGCVENACLPPASVDGGAVSPPPPSSSSDAGATASATVPLPPISDFDAVEVDIPWTDAIKVPERSLTIEGVDASELIGTWTARGCDPTQPIDPNSGLIQGCLQLVIRADSAGVSGQLRFVIDPPPPPLPPVRDPDVGYPPGLGGQEVDRLKDQPAPGVAYRLYDGRFHDGVFEFVWSPLDFFGDWCAAQTPQRWLIDGHPYYFCVPQDPQAQAQLDSVKLNLCLNAEERALCDDGFGNSTPCVCQDQSGGGCSFAACMCRPDRCETDTHWFYARATFTVEGRSMTGGWGEPLFSFPPLAATLDKEAP